MPKLYTWQECADLDITTVHQLYRNYISKSQADLFAVFGFGRTIATHAEGSTIHTADGRRILDFTGGIGVLHHGHNHPRVLEARIEYQRAHRMEVHKNFLSPYLAGLSHNVAQLLPEDLDVSYFCNSGAEAVEGAVKLAYKYHDGRRKHILHADISFHGKLLGTAGLTGSPELHFAFPQIPGIASFVYDDIGSVRQQVDTLKQPNGQSDIYAIIIEPLNASSLRACSGEFLRELRTVCTDNDIVLVFDEVYTCWGKTGWLFYFMKDGIVPDIVAMSKSIGGGKSSISCYTTRTPFFRKAYDNMNDVTLHSTTFNALGEECITAIEAINIVVQDDFPAKARRIFARLDPGLRRLGEKFPDMIQEVRGSGAIMGLILNGELGPTLKAAISFLPGQMFKDTRFIAKLVTSAVIAELYDAHGILTFFGSNRDIPLIISPCLVATDDQIDRFLVALDETLAAGRRRLVTKFAKAYFKARFANK